MGGEGAGLTKAAMNSRVATGLPELQAQTRFCECAEESGIDSLLTDFGFSKPDPILLAAALGLVTKKIKFIIAYRSGLLCPTSFVQQLNTLSALINGRFSLNIVAGHSPQEQRFYGDYLAHDERYARTDEFLSICQAFWRSKEAVSFDGEYYRVDEARLNTPFISGDGIAPEIFIAGSSAAAQRLAVRHGTCWLQIGDAPDKLRAAISPALAAGIEVGLRMAIIARPTREEAVHAAYSLRADLNVQKLDVATEKDFVRNSDSVSVKTAYDLENEWLTSYLWTGAVRQIGTAAIALVGSPEEIADAIMEYRDIGVTQFIFSGWPKLEEMRYFGQEVLPVIKRKEQLAGRPGAHATVN
jgi:alkanesulfonate monooxygenase